MRLRWVGRLVAPLALSAVIAGASPAVLADTVLCKDGSQSQAGRGACSHHGGVVANVPAQATHPGGQVGAPKVVVPPPAPPPLEQPPRSTRSAPPPAVAPPPPSHPAARPAAPPGDHPTAQCRDGSFSYARHHSGACSRHGGVSRWTDGTAL